ncbi:glycosyltransferase family 4 protein [Kocuria palustris]|uniref:glycosyltransferase family 4 protein n=1 Tax=Kocuria palustris TaxID=71999 RepID=UPI00344D5335
MSDGRLMHSEHPIVTALETADAKLATATLRSLLSAHEYETAVDLMGRWADRFDADVDYLKVRRAVLGKLGELSQALLVNHRLAELRAVSMESLAGLEGRVRELSGRVPRLAGPRRPVEPISDTRIVHLVKESRPYLSNGFTSRSHSNFLAEKKAGLEPIVVTEPGFPRSVLGSLPRSEAMVDGIGHYVLDLGTDLSALPDDRFLQVFADMAYERISKIRPAAIHVSSGRRGYETALVALAIKDKTGLPVIYEVRSFFESNWTGEVRYEAQGEIFNSRRRIELECMQRADLVLTIGESMKQEIVARGIPEEKVGLVPNGVYVERFSPRGRSAELAEAHGLTGVPTFGYVSNMDHYRESQETLIAAAAHLAAAGRPEHCVLVGDGPRREKLERLAESYGVADRVHLLGRVDHDEIPDYYSLIDVFVVPRTSERAATYVTPLKPFEAMAMGLPVVVSDLPALREIAPSPERGWTFTPDDARGLARILGDIFDDPAERERRAGAGLQWVRTQRQWDHNGPRYVEALRAALAAAAGKED